jgi:hypothetical protein
VLNAKPGDVVELDDYRPGWMIGIDVCSNCGYVCVSVVHRDRQWSLECPRCGQITCAFVPEVAIDEEGLRAFREEQRERWDWLRR